LKDIQELYNKGKRQWLSGLHLDALDTYGSIIAEGHGDCGANMNSAVILASLGRRDEAESHFQKAMSACPDDRDLAVNYAMHLLSTGRLAEGFRLYESREWNVKPPGIKWKGEDCDTLLVVPEQGNGDMVQFARFLPEAKKRCRKMILMCFGSLLRTMESMQVADEIVEFNPGDEFVEAEGGLEGEVPYDRFVRMMSIPHLTGATGPVPGPYITPDPELTEFWSSKIRGENLKVGICWRGLKRPKEDSAALDSRRSVPLEYMSPLLDIEGVDFYSLQKDPSETDIRMKSIMGEVSDFADTTAIISNLDLVVSVDTAVAHLAAATGKETWLLNRKDSCWRWGGEGEETPWYRSMRIFRQEEMMEWKPVIERVSGEIKKKLEKRSGS